VIGVLLALVFIFFLFDRIIMPLYTRQGSEHPIPSLMGLTVAEAKARADSAGFRIVEETPKLGSHVPEGTIIEQHPFAESLAKSGRTIRVIPAMGAKPNVTPDVVGLDLRDAQLQCRNAGLSSGDSDVRYRFSERAPKGTVVAQEPRAGETLKPGSAVKLTISMGPQPAHFYVPYLMEKPLNDARTILREAGLKLGKIVRKETDLYPSNTVIAQSPKSGDEVESGAAIDVVVAVPMPKTEEKEAD